MLTRLDSLPFGGYDPRVDSEKPRERSLFLEGHEEEAGSVFRVHAETGQTAGPVHAETAFEIIVMDSSLL